MAGIQPGDDEQRIACSQTSEDLKKITLVVVNLNPHHPQIGLTNLDLEQLSIEASETYQVQDLLTEVRRL